MTDLSGGIEMGGMEIWFGFGYTGELSVRGKLG